MEKSTVVTPSPLVGIGVKRRVFFLKDAVIASASEAIQYRISTKFELDCFAHARNDYAFWCRTA